MLALRGVLRTVLAFVAGASFVAVALWPHAGPRPDLAPDAAQAKPAAPVIDEAAAIVVELAEPPGLPSTRRRAGGAPRDSAAARRQALARTLRAVERRPPVVPSGERDPETEARVGGAMREALLRALEGE